MRSEKATRSFSFLRLAACDTWMETKVTRLDFSGSVHRSRSRVPYAQTLTTSDSAQEILLIGTNRVVQTVVLTQRSHFTPLKLFSRLLIFSLRSVHVCRRFLSLPTRRCDSWSRSSSCPRSKHRLRSLCFSSPTFGFGVHGLVLCTGSVPSAKVRHDDGKLHQIKPVLHCSLFVFTDSD